MAMDPAKRREYQQRTGLTDEKIRQTMGNFTVDRDAARAKGLSDRQIDAARAGVQAVVEDCTIISAAYNETAKQANRDAREVVDRATLAADRATLAEAFTEDYRLTDPNGNVGGREKTLDAIFSGKIRKEAFGSGGFETLEDEFVIHGESAVSVGVFRMNATQMARNVKTGEIRRRERNGTFKTTHTYVLQKGAWRLASSQLTKMPDERPSPEDANWVFIDD
jgi:hypothetical protein